MKKAVWISYDLGVKGDYESLWAWLDEQHAKECVGSLAFITYSYKGDLIKCLRDEFKKTIEVNKRTRIYAIWRDEETKKVKGHFLFGGRRVPPWAGYGVEEETFEMDES